MATQAQCTACRATIPIGSAFCGVCGAQQPAGCTGCGAPLLTGAAFCGACGTTVASSATQPAAAPTTCSSCQADLPAGAAFCGDCGATVSAAPGPPRPSTSCPKCQAPLREGARFCRKCGTQVGGAPPTTARTGPPTGAAAGQPPQLSAQTSTNQLTWSSAAAGVGFIVAAISPFLAWFSAGGFSVTPFDSGVRFRLGDALGTDSIDGLVPVLLALAGLAVLVAFLSGRLETAKGRYWIAGLGVALAALGLIEIQFIASETGSWDIGFGLYLLVAGGLLAAASPWIPATKIGGR